MPFLSARPAVSSYLYAVTVLSELSELPVYVTLTGGGRPNYSRETVMEMLAQPAPYLEELTLDETLTPFLLAGEVPIRLRRLRLLDMRLPPTICVLQAPILRVLEIRNTYIWPDRTSLLEGLRRLPNLEILILDTFEPGMPVFDHDPPPQPYHSIPLRRLRYLEVRDVVADYIIERIQMPSNVSISVAVEVADIRSRHRQVYRDMAKNIHSHIPAEVFHGLQFRTLYIHPHQTYEDVVLPAICFTVSMQLPIGPYLPVPANIPPRMTYVMEWCDARAKLTPVQHRISRLMDCFVCGARQIVSLSVSHDHFVVPEEWESIDKRCPAIRIIIASGDAAHGLIAALRARSQTALFPRLTTLFFNDTDLGGQINGRRTSVDGLMQALGYRAKGPGRVLKLIIGGCSVSAQQMHVLREHGQKYGYQVGWDGRTERTPIVRKGNWVGREDERARLLAGNYERA